jgi:dienelactone hydrolase
MRQRRGLTLLLMGVLLALTGASRAQSPQVNLWTPEVMLKIRDRGTLRPQVIARAGYFELFFDSEIGDARWADSTEPYAVHTGGTVRIHGYLATPVFGGPYPAVVIGHGHGGSGSPELAMALAALGYVALSIDGPQAGLSTGGPRDTEQAWVSVEEQANQPSPSVGYLYHYAYAGMRALTLLDRLSRLFLNPFRIDRSRFGVMGASMGGQFTYYVNGVDSRVKGAVAIAVAGDWKNLLPYEGAWLYHGLYYYTRDGLQSGQDHLNTISDVCADPTLDTFLRSFDPISYAPTQHGPLLTIIGTHDQYFTVPAINTTYDRTASAGTNLRFAKRVMLVPNGKHGVVEGADPLPTVLGVLNNVDAWFKYCFRSGPAAPGTPTVRLEVIGSTMRFRVAAPAGTRPIRSVDLHYATQIDTLPETPRDFGTIRLSLQAGEYVGSLPIGASPPAGPPVTPANVLYFASVRDEADYTVTSRIYYRGAVMDFGMGFVPRIEHWPRDSFPVPPPPPRALEAAPETLRLTFPFHVSPVRETGAASC